MQHDLCSADVVGAIDRYGVKLKLNALRKWDPGLGGSPDGKSDDQIFQTPIAAHVGMLATCDGSPSIALLRRKDGIRKQRADAAAGAAAASAAGQETHRFAAALQDGLNNASGGFHHLLELVKMRGRFWEHTHLRAFYGKWRNSEPKLQMGVLCPSDPTACLSESLEYLFAHYVDCSRRAAHEHEGSEDTFDSAYVFDYMLRRAREHPIVYIVLLELRFLEVRPRDT